MSIERVIIKNYRVLRDVDLKLRPGLNVIVGNNESGRSTLLEAINLALRCQLNRRPAQGELHPFLFNAACVKEFISDLIENRNPEPPKMLIELYLQDLAEYALLKGTVNSLFDDAPGISLSIELDGEAFGEEYPTYIRDPAKVKAVPVEYYKVEWMDFSGQRINPRRAPLKSSLIDPSAISNTFAANRYVLEIARDFLGRKEQVALSLSYRQLRDQFLEDASVKAVNEQMKNQASSVSSRALSIALDMSARSGWESGVLPHVDDIPLTLAGKGEQNSLKIKLALLSEAECDIFLIEEPENHLSHSNLNALIGQMAKSVEGRQLIVTTHSSFVLNKLGVESIIMFDGKSGITLGSLPPSTKDYFMRLPGHDTLRMILAKKVILVEGPSDELIVQKAFLVANSIMPLEAGVDVISVSGLAAPRFLDIARLMDLDIRVVLDNDEDVSRLERRYGGYSGKQIRLCYSRDESLRTLEYHLVQENGRALLNKVFDTKHGSDEELRNYMLSNKTECALKIFETKEPLKFPQYIRDAIA